MPTVLRRCALLLLPLLLFTGCSTSDATLRESGRSEAFILGFHDGRHSGMKEAGNDWEHYIKDYDRFDTNPDYRDGWLAGEVEGKKLQAQAQTVGEAAAGAYTQDQVSKEGPHPKRAAREAMKGVDTDALKALEK